MMHVMTKGDSRLDPIVDAGMCNIAKLHSALQPGYPKDANVERIRSAQYMFRKMMPAFAASLLLRSLPMTYCDGREGTQALGIANGFSNYNQRMLNTLRWLKNVSGEDAPNAIHETRVIHALARKRIKESVEWPKDIVPIDQDRLKATVCTFSIVAISGLRTLGIDVTLDEENNFLYMWSVFGEMLGIESPYMSLDSAHAFMTNIEEQFVKSKEGQALASMHVEFLKKNLFSFELSDKFVEGLVSYMLGKRNAEILNIKGDVTSAGLFLKGWAKKELMLMKYMSGERLHVRALNTCDAYEKRWITNTATTKQKTNHHV